MENTSKVRSSYIVILLSVLALAMAFRLPKLDLRPMHHDEANQAVKCGEMLDGGRYKYDPVDHHGPTLYFLTVPVARLTGAVSFAASTEVTYRLVPVLFGTGVVLLFFLLGNKVGRVAAVSGAVLAAISPAMVFYSRYYIQEMILVFFTFGLIIAGWRYFVGGSCWWAATAGLCGGMMLATKETGILALAAVGVALLVTAVWMRNELGDLGSRSGARGMAWWHALMALGVAALVYIALFSSFFTNWTGVSDSFLAYSGFVRKGTTGGNHVQAFHHYFQVLFFWKGERGRWWGEGLILILALIGLAAGVTGRGLGSGNKVFVRFFAIYTVAITLIYSLIPYKTPWCAITFLQAMIVLAGIGAAALVRAARGTPAKVALVMVIAVAAVNLGWQARSLNFKYFAEVENPYAYVHTSKDFLNLVKRVDELAKVSLKKKDMLVTVVVSPESVHDMWPLPWYLRRYSQVGYFSTGDVPTNLNAEVTISSGDMAEAVMVAYGPGLGMSMFSLRPNVFLTLVVRPDLWEAFLKRRRDGL